MDGGSTDDAGGGSFAGLGGLERWRAHWQIGALCVVSCGSLLLNAILLIAFIRKPGLRTISNRFVMNLIASNIISVIVLTGLLIVGTCDGASLDYSAVPTFCAVSDGATALVTTSSILSVLLIGVDQYLAVVDPLRYRTRIDKLKCALLILGVWLIALLFAGLASLNPQPRSLWRLCSAVGRGRLDDDDLLPASSGAPTELTFQASLVLRGNASESANLEIQGAFSLRNQQLELYNASGTMILGNATDDALPPASPRANPPGTYGLLYALAYTLLGYLLPFLAVCWIYVSIYTAARSNSERTRRNGSRPILSSGSLSEDAATPGQHSSLEDFRRIAKISSLSSIAENSEALTPDPQVDGELDPQAAVIFTVGSSKLEADANAKETDTRSNVPTAAKPDSPEPPKPPPHDLMYEEMMIDCERHPYEYEDDELASSSDEEEPEEEADHRRDFEEAQPLSAVIVQPSHEPRNSSARSISVNFDLGDGHPEEPLQAPSQRVAPQPPPIVTITPPAHKSQSTASLHKSSSGRHTTGGYINNLKYRISNGSLFKYREETRAARISAFVIVMGLICWTPYVYVLLSRNLAADCLHEPESPVSLDSVALGFLILATYVSPLLFGYRSRRIKRELRKFFCFRRELSYKNNRSLMAKKVLRRRHSGATVLGQFVGEASLESSRYSIFNCVYGRNRWPKDKVQFVQVPDSALAVETCRSSFSSGASTQISSTSTDEC